MVEPDHVTWPLASDWLAPRLSVFKRKSSPVRRQSQIPRAQDSSGMICKVTITRCHDNSVNIKMFVTALADHNSECTELMNDYPELQSACCFSDLCKNRNNPEQMTPNQKSVAIAVS